MSKIIRLVAFVLAFALCACAQKDPLPSWNDTALKAEITGFVQASLNKASPSYIAEEERVAVFDNDGTLWQEQPVVEMDFIKTLIAEKVKENPALKNDKDLQAIAKGDIAYLQAHPKALDNILSKVYANMSIEQYAARAAAFLQSATHPALNKKYTELTYKPMRELMAYLRANGFKVYICSGGSQNFMRVFAKTLYGVPPENVIGMLQKHVYEVKDGRGDIYLTALTISANDMKEKPVGIEGRTGRVPVFAAGNVRSNGDIEMLSYSMNSPRSFQLLIYHDDAEREFTYNDSNSLSAAKANNWHIVSMKSDWKEIF